VREEHFDPFFTTDITGGSAVELIEGRLEIVIWKSGEAERVVVKHRVPVARHLSSPRRPQRQGTPARLRRPCAPGG
jgi:hypothetical protein